jgi:hypothetical protein
MNLTCFYCQTPFTLSMDQKIAALRKMHAENLHHYDAHCPRCGRANAISRERLEMFTPGWEEAIKEPAMGAPVPAGAGGSAMQREPNAAAPSPIPAERREPENMPAMKKQPATPSRRRHAPAAKKAARKGPAKKAAAKKAPAKKKTAAKPKKKATTKAKSKSSSRKTARKSR